MTTIREEDIINRPSENQALTDSCGDDKSQQDEDREEMMTKLECDSFPKFESGLQPSSNTIGTIENQTDAGGSFAGMPQTTNTLSDLHSQKNCYNSHRYIP